MIAFYDTTQLQSGQNKSEVLAHGIYTALVTTLCGLIIAIVAAIIAHYFEGRIQLLFHQIDELLFNLLPQVERYEGRVRFSHPGESNTELNGDSNGDSNGKSKSDAAVEPPPISIPTDSTD